MDWQLQSAIAYKDQLPNNPMPIVTDRLILTPLQLSDSEEMHLVLDHINLHTFTGGEPLSLDELQKRFAKLESGSGRDTETWVNLIVRLKPEKIAIGYVQATIYNEDLPCADIAWVIGISWQGKGYATEAATALVTWLQNQGINEIRANINPSHEASKAIARRLGMHPTDVQVDEETQWKLSPAHQ
jgi:RimJ/RimL family protein N-acetyltransferase